MRVTFSNKNELYVKCSKYASSLSGPNYQSTEKVKQKELDRDAELETEDAEIVYTNE
jgi:hypothetical protein